MPTGLTDLREDIVKAIAREVKEETGLSNIKFQHTLCSREAHSNENQSYLTGHSDAFLHVWLGFSIKKMWNLNCKKMRFWTCNG